MRIHSSRRWVTLLKNVFKTNKLTAQPVVSQQINKYESSNIGNSRSMYIFQFNTDQPGSKENVYWHNTVGSTLSITAALTRSLRPLFLRYTFRAVRTRFLSLCPYRRHDMLTTAGRVLSRVGKTSSYGNRDDHGGDVHGHGYGNNLDRYPGVGQIQIRALAKFRCGRLIEFIRWIPYELLDGRENIYNDNRTQSRISYPLFFEPFNSYSSNNYRPTIHWNSYNLTCV